MSKVLFAVFAAALVTYAAFGNVYVFLFTFKELKRVSLSKYGGSIVQVGCEYDAAGGRYVFHTRDVDGVEADFVYDTEGNTFSDGYAEASSRVLYYSVRGRMTNKITSSGVYAEDVHVIYENKLCLVRDALRISEEIVPDEVIVVLDDGGSRDAFCDMALKILNVLKNEKLPEITLKSENYVMTVSDGLFPSERNDVRIRIRNLSG